MFSPVLHYTCEREKKETCITNKKEKKNYEKNENYSLRSGTVDNGVHTAVV